MRFSKEAAWVKPARLETTKNPKTACQGNGPKGQLENNPPDLKLPRIAKRSENTSAMFQKYNLGV